MRRLLILNHVTSRSGGEIALVRLLRRLDKTRFDIVVALPSGRGMLVDELSRVEGVRLVVVRSGAQLIGTRRGGAIWMLVSQPWILLQFFALVVEHARLIRKMQIDVVLTNSIKSDYYGSLAAALTRRRLVWYVHDIVDRHYFPAWASWSLICFAKWFPAQIACNSEATCEALVRRGVAREKVRRVYPVLDFDELGRTMPSDVRRELGVEPATKLVTLVGRITYSKGQLEFVRAAAIVCREMPGVVFLIVGDSVFGGIDDEYRQQVQTCVDELPNPASVRLLGMRSDALSIIAASDVVVFPSLWPEGFGLAVAEAMALGRPVVATRLGGTAEMIDDRVTGLAVTPGDVAGLASAVERVLGDSVAAKELAAAGTGHITKLLAPDNVVTFERMLIGERDPS